MNNLMLVFTHSASRLSLQRERLLNNFSVKIMHAVIISWSSPLKRGDADRQRG